jgi:subtilisin-like proprotein convertase family protein
MVLSHRTDSLKAFAVIRSLLQKRAGAETSNGKMNSRIALLLAWVTLAVPAYCATNTFTAAGNVGIVDDGYNGTMASMSSLSLAIPASGMGVVRRVAVRLAIAHTWIGDLVIKVQSPSGTLVTLMSIPGMLEASDNGTSVSGDSSNLSASFPIRFEDGAPKSAENMGNTILNAQNVCEHDLACTYDPNNGAATAGKLAAFNGQSMLGTWRLLAGDSALGDFGTINEFTLIIVTDDLPQMHITRTNNAVTITWPTNTTGFTLESNERLRTNGWAVVNGSPAISGTNYLVNIPTTNVASFFRLRK